MTNAAILLGVNIDHIANVRQTRGTRYPDPIYAAMVAEEAGADGITVHLREDRRHIQERDVLLLQDVIQTRLNLEMAATADMIVFAKRVKPAHCCLVPEKREELTTEGGLDVLGQLHKMVDVCQELAEAAIAVSLFIEPDKDQIDAAVECRVAAVELHSGTYAETSEPGKRAQELARLVDAADYAHQVGLTVNAGHGLNYHNVKPVAQIKVLNELNIGHAIVAQACFVGFATAVREMKKLMLGARLIS